MKRYIEFDREKILDYYRETLPDYKVNIITTSNINSPSEYHVEITFEKDGVRKDLEYIVTVHGLLTPNEILSQV